MVLSEWMKLSGAASLGYEPREGDREELAQQRQSLTEGVSFVFIRVKEVGPGCKSWGGH